MVQINPVCTVPRSKTRYVRTPHAWFQFCTSFLYCTFWRHRQRCPSHIMSTSRPRPRVAALPAAAGSTRTSPAARVIARWVQKKIPWYADDAMSPVKRNDPAFCVTIADVQHELDELDVGTSLSRPSSVPVPLFVSNLCMSCTCRLGSESLRPRSVQD